MAFQFESTASLGMRFIDAIQRMESIPFLSNDVHLTPAEAYDIQSYVTRQLCEAEHTEVVGYKIAATTKEAQEHFQMEEPVFGTYLTGSISHTSAAFSLAELREPLIEPEIAFILHDDLDREPTEEDIISACRVAPAFEIPESRYRQWRRPVMTLGDMIADNAFVGRLVLGDPVDISGGPAELGRIQVEVTFDGEVIARGDSSIAMGNPLRAVRWLARKVATSGQTLRAGVVVSSGTLVKPKRPRVGVYSAAFSSLGRVTASFS